MKEFGDFLAQYWQLIIAAILTVISTVVALIRKKPVSSIVQDIYELVEKAIRKVEFTQLNSTDKKGAAMEIVIAGLTTKYPSCDVKKYYKFIDIKIEDILALPQKKGVIVDE